MPAPSPIRQAFAAGAAFMRRAARFARHDAQYDRAPAQIEWPDEAAIMAAATDHLEHDRPDDDRPSLGDQLEEMGE